MNETVRMEPKREHGRKHRRVFAALLATGLAFFGIVPAAHAAQTTIDFDDTALHHCVNGVLNDNPGDPVTIADAQSLTSLSCTNSGITSLEGLEHFSGLQNLYLSNNEITDITPLTELQDLADLWLSNNEGITDISPLGNLTAPHTIALSYNDQISDLSVLGTFTNISRLELSGLGGTHDFSFINGLHQLESLSVADNSLTNISFLEGLTSLKALFLNHNPIDDFTPLNTLTGLTSLRAVVTGMTDLSFVEYMPNLGVLWVNGNHIADLSPAQQILTPQHIDARNQTVSLGDLPLGESVSNPVVGIDGNPVAIASTQYDSNTNLITPSQLGAGSITWDDAANFDGEFSGTVTFNAVEPPVLVDIPDAALRACINDELGQSAAAQITVAQAESMTNLFCANEGVANLTGLEAFVHLELAGLWGNNISDLTPLAALAALESLYLNDNVISDVAPLASLSNLTGLDLNDNEITDVAPLASLTSLESLEISNNLIGDIGDLAPLTQLLFLEAGGNALSDLSVIQHFSLLEALGVEDNHIAEISVLAGIADQLWLLDVSGNHIADLSPLGGHQPAEWFSAANQTVDLGEIVIDEAATNPVVWIDGTSVELNEAIYDAAANTFTPESLGAGSLTWGEITEPEGFGPASYNPDVFNGVLSFTAVAAPVEPVAPDAPGGSEDPAVPVDEGTLATTGQEGLGLIAITVGAALLFAGIATYLVARQRQRHI